MGISEKTRKILWVQAGGLCAVCKAQVITSGTASDDPSVFGEEAHIVARSEGGPRAGGLAENLINHHTNLILLCSNDHKRVDDQPNHFTVERLRLIKSEHEAWVRSVMDADASRLRLVPDPLFPQPKMLKLITRGNPLWNMVKESVTFEYAIPDHLNDDVEDLIIEFMDLLRDFLDIAGDLVSVRENRDAEKALQQYISRLAEREFLVGAYVRHMLLKGGSADSLTPWPMLRVEVQPATLAEVADENGTPYSDQG
ncbi:HNH endonuclease [Streptomyces kunmingensis]|uniref:HNH endonuclease n=1 Tax=Streptomyces kunmingensis TaxID=68225 RepID=A0ABU6CNX2_9ACTN|nr:HNH endonuclease signature motif containing protein [Streptomyces kunmingensis]MEB3965615.1 HNH endonuclease [Streptomyces kunmingensis]